MNKGIKLFATPRSHFARKVRILMDLYQIPYEFHDVGNIADISKTPTRIGNNPMMKVPVLQHGEDWLIESDHIASYIVDLVDKHDRYAVNAKDVFSLNAKAMLNTVMSESVKVIVARRQNVPTDQYEYFGKAQEAVDNGLLWLNENHSKFDVNSSKYREFHLVCCWDLTKLYNFVPGMTEKYPYLSDIVSRVSENEIVSRSAPK